MTPVEERIDHEEVKRIAEILVRDIDRHRAWVPGPDEDKPSGLFFVHEDVEPVFRAYLALLTEHSAREEAMEAVEEWVKALAAFMETGGSDHKTRRTALAFAEQNLVAALPATESAQPEEELTVLGRCPHGVDLDREFCPEGCRV